MPKSRNGAKKVAGEKKNRGALAQALQSEDAIVGFVTAELGNKTFRVKLRDGKEVQGLIRGVLSGGRNSETRVSNGRYVILTPSTTKIHEISCVINTKNGLRDLKEAGLIEEDAHDDLFEEDSADAKELDEEDIDDI